MLFLSVVVDRVAEILSFIVFDPFTDLFITLCIVVNTGFMGLDQVIWNIKYSKR